MIVMREGDGKVVKGVSYMWKENDLTQGSEQKCDIQMKYNRIVHLKPISSYYQCHSNKFNKK